MSKGKGFFGGKDEEQDPAEAPLPSSATTNASSPNARTPVERTAAEPPKDKDGRELNVAGKPVSEETPPLGDSDLTQTEARKPAAATGERESWGQRPTVKALEDVRFVEVRTADPNLKRTYAAGVEVGREPRRLSLDHVRSLGKERLAALVDDPAIELRIADADKPVDQPADKPVDQGDKPAS